MEAHANGVWNDKTMQWEDAKTGLTISGYGINEPIKFVSMIKRLTKKFNIHKELL